MRAIPKMLYGHSDWMLLVQATLYVTASAVTALKIRTLNPLAAACSFTVSSGIAHVIMHYANMPCNEKLNLKDKFYGFTMLNTIYFMQEVMYAYATTLQKRSLIALNLILLGVNGINSLSR